MRDINEPIRIAYADALSQVPEVGVYYQAAPNNINPDNYIVFRSINSNDTSTKDSARLSLSITVEIHTKGNITNQGLNPDRIADIIFQLVYPHKHTNLTLSRGRILWTRIGQDVTQDFRQGNQFGYISRFLTFTHEIAVDDEGDDPGTEVASGQVFRLEYEATGGETGFTNTNLNVKSILAVTNDGVDFSPIIFAGTPVEKEVLYLSATGAIVFPTEMEPGQKAVVIYQLLDDDPVITFEYTATGGETDVTDAELIDKNVVAVKRDGVDASYIISSGSPVNKEALYETSTGTVSFASALEPGEQVKILYQI
jgi:hypothetical protein